MLSVGENPTSTLCKSSVYLLSLFTVEVYWDIVLPSIILPVLSSLILSRELV